MLLRWQCVEVGGEEDMEVDNKEGRGNENVNENG